MSYPLVVYTESGDWKRVLSEGEELALRPEYKRFQEWKIPVTHAEDTVKIQNDIIIPDVPVVQTQPVKRPGRPPKRY